MISADLHSLIASRAATQRASAGDVLFGPGDPCRHFFLLVAGTVRVEMRTYGGRDLLLYRVGPGEACALTVSCLLAGERYAASGIADTDVEARALPASAFEELLGESAAFRRHVFTAFGDRLKGLMSRIEEVLSHGLDPRLARFLLNNADAQGRVAYTHQRIAVELAAAREAVSRRLKSYQRAGWIELGRGQIQLQDSRALAVVAESAPPRPDEG